MSVFILKVAICWCCYFYLRILLFSLYMAILSLLRKIWLALIFFIGYNQIWFKKWYCNVSLVLFNYYLHRGLAPRLLAFFFSRNFTWNAEIYFMLTNNYIHICVALVSPICSSGPSYSCRKVHSKGFQSIVANSMWDYIGNNVYNLAMNVLLPWSLKEMLFECQYFPPSSLQSQKLFLS